jgi:hypothetical protein
MSFTQHAGPLIISLRFRWTGDEKRRWNNWFRDDFPGILTEELLSELRQLDLHAILPRHPNDPRMTQTFLLNIQGLLDWLHVR